MRRRQILILVAALALFLLSLGCGGESKVENGDAAQEGDSVNGVDETVAEDSEGLVDGGFYTVKSIFDFSRLFIEVEYSFTENGSTSTFSYQFLGEETVDGVDVYHMKIEADGEAYEIWSSIDDEEVVRAIYDGQTMEGQEAAMMSYAVWGYMFPFTMMTAWDEAFLNPQTMAWFGWQVESKDKVSRDLGAGNIDVNRFEIKVADSGLTWTYEIAEIEGRNLFIGWEVEEDGSLSEFKITRLIPR